MPTQVQQPPPELPHDAHNKHANALHRDALLQALGSILAPKRPLMNTRSSSASTVDSSRSSSGTASPAHGVHPVLSHIPTGLHSPALPPPPPHSTPVPHPHPHAHPHSPLGESSFVPEADADADTASTQDRDAPTAAADSPAVPTAAARAKFINSLKSKNGAWDALIHGSFS